MSEATKTKKKLSIPVKLAIALVLGAIAGLRRLRMWHSLAPCSFDS